MALNAFHKAFGSRINASMARFAPSQYAMALHAIGEQFGPDVQRQMEREILPFEKLNERSESFHNGLIRLSMALQGPRIGEQSIKRTKVALAPLAAVGEPIEVDAHIASLIDGEPDSELSDPKRDAQCSALYIDTLSREDASCWRPTISVSLDGERFIRVKAKDIAEAESVYARLKACITSDPSFKLNPHSACSRALNSSAEYGMLHQKELDEERALERELKALLH